MQSGNAQFWAIVNRSWTQADQRVLANRADAVDDGEISLIAAFPYLFTEADLKHAGLL